MKELAKALNIELDDSMTNAFEVYYKMLIDWNSKINLTAITEREDVFVKHFADSLTAVRFLPQRATVLDVGSGAGFPGIPLAIVRPDLRVTLLDSLNKRVLFQKAVCETLNISNVECMHSRIEDFPHKNHFDVVVSRAVASLPTLLEYTVPFARSGGIVVAYKSQGVSEEIIKARNALTVLACNIVECPTFFLPNTDISRTLIVVKKSRTTPQRFPRGLNKPKKDPL